MSPSEKKAEWVRFVKANPRGYTLNALRAVLENDGEKMLNEVLKELGLASALDVVKECRNDWTK